MSLLENIRVFIRVVELGSLSAAGRHLRLSPAVVSHRLQQLEQHLGSRLLNRTTRQVSLTEQGQAFLEACGEVVAAVERAEAAVAEGGTTPRGELKVTAPLGLGRRIVAPAVPSFQERYPQIGVRLRLSDHVVDLLKEAVDVGIRLAILEDSSLIARRIASCPRVVCAAPRYLERRGMPLEPADLLEHTCLLLRFPGTPEYRWTLTGPDGPVTLAVAGPRDADDADVLTAWALAGHGLVMKPAYEIADELREGRLVPVLQAFPPEPLTLAVVYPHRRLLPAKVKAFADFIGPVLAAAVAPGQGPTTTAAPPASEAGQA